MTKTRAHHAPIERPIALLVGRVAMVGVAYVLAWAALGATGIPTAFPPAALVGVVALLPVNVVCLIWVRRLVRDDGGRLADLAGFSTRRLGTDILWGLLWLAVLYLPFVLTVLGVMALLHGSVMFDRFETVFFDPASVPALPSWAMTALALVGVLTFAPINAPAEEFVYRGYGQRELARRLPVWAAIAGSAALFGLQHAFFAATPDAVLVYVCAFFVWGVGSGIIAHRQGRLMPIIIAHFLINLAMTAPVLVFVVQSATTGV